MHPRGKPEPFSVHHRTSPPSFTCIHEAASSREASWMACPDSATAGAVCSISLASSPGNILALVTEASEGPPGRLGTVTVSPGSHHCPSTYLTRMMRLCRKEGPALHSSRPTRQPVSKSAPCDRLTCRLRGPAAAGSDRGERGPGAARGAATKMALLSVPWVPGREAGWEGSGKHVGVPQV